MIIGIPKLGRHVAQEGSSISRQNLNENLETLHLAPTLFYHLLGFNFKTWFLNPHPLSLVGKTVQWSIVSIFDEYEIIDWTLLEMSEL